MKGQQKCWPFVVLEPQMNTEGDSASVHLWLKTTLLQEKQALDILHQ